MGSILAVDIGPVLGIGFIVVCLVVIAILRATTGKWPNGMMQVGPFRDRQ